MSSRTYAPRLIDKVALAGLVAFLACAGIEHLLSPSLDPARHQISEYVHTQTGAVMTVGFLAWALSLATTALVVWREWKARALAILLALASVGMLLTACFATQTSAGMLPPHTTLSATGRLHDLGSGLTGLALLLAAITSAIGSRTSKAFRERTVALIAVALLGSGVLLALGSSVGGIRQRLTILVGCLWQFLLLEALARRAPHPSAL
jgi:ABC-type transport system involved in cytochrome bd biosynthesis fused ATPase/permease subunit